MSDWYHRYKLSIKGYDFYHATADKSHIHDMVGWPNGKALDYDHYSNQEIPGSTPGMVNSFLRFCTSRGKNRVRGFFSSLRFNQVRNEATLCSVRCYDCIAKPGWRRQQP